MTKRIVLCYFHIHTYTAMDDQKAKKHNEIEQLVSLSQRGSSDAFAQLYDLFVNQIYKYIYYRVGAKDAEDLTELVFLKTWENIKQYKSGYRNFSSWIFKIAHNIVVDFYRSNHKVDELNENVEDSRIEASSTQMASKRLNQELLTSAMKGLKDEYRQILILSYMNEMANEEISHIMGRSQAALRILKFRALRSLRKIFEQMGIRDVNA